MVQMYFTFQRQTIKGIKTQELPKMTDSMKFGPEWLRNMSAEPSNIGANNLSATASGGPNSGPSLHSLGGGSGGGVGVGGGVLSNPCHTAANRNMFPEYRYGREEMLSLFDRNCILPQILPSFKKLFIEKVQYPLALTPSSEDEVHSQSQLSSSVSVKEINVRCPVEGL